MCVAALNMALLLYIILVLNTFTCVKDGSSHKTFSYKHNVCI